MVEAVLLSGGESSRMGADKASVMIEGEGMGVRIARKLSEAGYRVTILGDFPDDSYVSIPDREPHAGPLVALSGFVPSGEFVFVCSCDIPLFDAGIVAFLRRAIGDADAAMPIVNGRQQFLCALYRASCFGRARELVECRERQLRAWVAGLIVRPILVEEIAAEGLDPRCVVGANTPAELAALLGQH